MATNPASAALAGNAGGGGTPPADGTTQTSPPPPPPAGNEGTTWYGDAHKDLVAAKGWPDVNAALESYKNLEKLTGMPDDVRADRVLLKPKDGATAEEIKEFYSKAGITAPKEIKDYGFTDEQLASNPVLGEAAKWAQETGIPKELLTPFIEKALAHDAAGVKAWNEQSNREWGELQATHGDGFGDMQESARRFAQANEIDAETMNKIEFAIGTKKMFDIFSKAGKSMTEATPPNPGRAGGGQFAMTPAAARAKIDSLKSDAAFQSRLLSPNQMQRAEATAEWEALHKALAGTA